jgi:hypothetical protein
MTDQRPNAVLGDLFHAHLERVGVKVLPHPEPSGGSTDFGNVSREFAAAARSQDGHAALMQSVRAMAGLAYDLLTEPALLARAKEEFERTAKLRPS